MYVLRNTYCIHTRRRSKSATGDHVYDAPEEMKPDAAVKVWTEEELKKCDAFRFGSIMYWLHENRMPFYKEQLEEKIPYSLPNIRRIYFNVKKPSQEARWVKIKFLISVYTRDGQGTGRTVVVGVILEIFTIGVKVIFMVGGKKNFNHFFPFYKILANFFASFIILKFLWGTPTVNH